MSSPDTKRGREAGPSAAANAPRTSLRSAPAADARATFPDVIVLSHLRWDFVFQRPQHLLTRCARARRVFFVEEPIVEDRIDIHAEIEPRADAIRVARLRVPRGRSAGEVQDAQRRLVSRVMLDFDVRRYALWYYTPMALDFTRHLAPDLVVYDCMDELSGFAGAPPGLRDREDELFRRAHVVFCGGRSLYLAKRERHANIHAFPSSIDAAHFARARARLADPPDQRAIPRPRLGFFGVLDERFDRELVDEVARMRPDWQFVMLGPVAKIDPADLPRRPNLHYLGSRPYADLPAYLAHWQVALMPFALNEATRYISPTKTPEYLAAGRPVVSTPIHDVIDPYGDLGLVSIAGDAPSFAAACERALVPPSRDWLERVDAFLARTSWDRTWARMSALLEDEADRRARARASRHGAAPARGVAAAD